MNRPQSPCVKTPEYNFALCVERSIATKTGCKPYWNQFNVNGEVELPICENTSMLNRYSNINMEFQEMPREELVNASNCLMPCSYLEYTVSLCMKKVIKIGIVLRFTYYLLNLAFQIKQNPLKVGKENATFAGVLPVLDAKVRVLTEKEAYPILSFVADVGGILGLFIGFNFLMVWGVIVKCVPYFLKS